MVQEECECKPKACVQSTFSLRIEREGQQRLGEMAHAENSF